MKVYVLAIFGALIVSYACSNPNNSSEKKEDRKDTSMTLSDTAQETLKKTSLKIKHKPQQQLAGGQAENQTEFQKPDYLPSWNNTDTKKQIIDFVYRITDPNDPNFIPEQDRIAVFDNDGTLWPEKPTYFQIEFILYRIKQLAPQHKEWKRDKLIKAALAHDIQTIREKFGSAGLNRLMTITQAGMNTEAFDKIVKKWLEKARHPKTGKLFAQMVYLPMKDLIEFLKDNGFKVYVVSVSETDFIRALSEEVYGIPNENVIGSFSRPIYKKVNGKPVLIKTNNIVFINDGKAKPIAIHQIIGKKPVMAFGNGDNDIQMLEWCSANEYPNFSAFIHHTDKQREWAYDKNTNTGKLVRGLSIYKQNNWKMVDMKNDWKTIFVYESEQNLAQK